MSAFFNVHHNLEAIKKVALLHAIEHGCNYNIILMNPDSDGNFSREAGSTYEMVRDSYFEKERPNVKIIATTDQIQQLKQ